MKLRIIDQTGNLKTIIEKEVTAASLYVLEFTKAAVESDIDLSEYKVLEIKLDHNHCVVYVKKSGSL